MIYTGTETLPAQQHATFTEMITHRFADSPDREGMRFKKDGEWVSQSWAEVGVEANEEAAGLIALGLELEERVAIASDTRIEWCWAALAIALAGGALTTVYSSTGASDVAFILSDSNSRMLFAENQAQLDKINEERANLPELVKVILFEGEGDGDFAITLEQLRVIGREALAADPELVSRRAEQVHADMLATLIYTSGTTGRPKGVELLQSAWAYVGNTMRATDIISENDVEFRWLPLAHVFGSVLLATQVEFGYTCAVDGTVPKIMEHLNVIKPTFMGAVPRIFEKVHAAISAMAKAGGPEKAEGFARGIEAAKAYTALTAAGAEIPAELAAAYPVIQEQIIATVRGAMGGNIRFFISGSAPLSSDISEFFGACGMPVLEGYGLTETSALGTICRPDSLKSGTVGQPWSGTEIKIAEDGEILMKGPSIMRGYRNRPDANEEAFIDGWFATGDIGEFDDMGRLRITDRKKDLFKTSGGKYVAPSAIESQFKAVCGVASNMVVHANNRKFVSAIVTLDPDAAAAWATAQGKPTDIKSLSTDPAMIAYIQSSIDTMNAKLNHWEQVQKFVILDRDFSIEAGEITPSLKVKRKVVEERNKELLDSFYA